MHKVLENYVARDFAKVYLADGLTLDIVGMGNVRNRVQSDSIWKLQKVRHVSRTEGAFDFSVTGG
jgi:hypothetical protein